MQQTPITKVHKHRLKRWGSVALFLRCSIKGKKVHPGTRFLIVPASKGVLLEAMAKGYMQTLVEAGATFVTPGCAACLGTHQGILAAGETCISASSRNFPGRMGHPKAEIYIGSPASVAAAALEGEIADPTQYLD